VRQSRHRVLPRLRGKLLSGRSAGRSMLFLLDETDSMAGEQRPEPHFGLGFELQEKSELVLLDRIRCQLNPSVRQALAEDFGGIQFADAGQIFLPVHCPIP
jgi:hypothetical protein